MMEYRKAGVVSEPRCVYAGGINACAYVCWVLARLRLFQSLIGVGRVRLQSVESALTGCGNVRLAVDCGCQANWLSLCFGVRCLGLMLAGNKGRHCSVNEALY